MTLRRKVLGFILILSLTAVLLAVSTGCSGDADNAIIGSGNLTTEEMEFSNFTKVDVSHVFQANVTKGDSFSVSLTVDDNLLDYVVIRKSGDTLLIYLKSGYSYIQTTKIVDITMPEIENFSLSGASQGELSGFRSSSRLRLEASGASSINVDDMKAGDTDFDISGGSQVWGDIEIAEGRFNVSGASSVDLEGYASNVSITASGASHVNLADFTISNVTVNISGASAATVNASGSIDGNVSGASRLTYLGNPALTITTSGDSIVDHR